MKELFRERPVYLRRGREPESLMTALLIIVSSSPIWHDAAVFASGFIMDRAIRAVEL